MCLLVHGHAHAQDRSSASSQRSADASAAQASAASPSVTAPKPIGSTEVAYPPGAQGDSAVMLLVTVNADGTVRCARTASGAPPFDQAAVDAAQTWHFTPARRDGVPVAATIRVQVLFRAPAVREAEPEAAESAPAPPPSTTAPGTKPSQHAAPSPSQPQEPLEVTVTGEKRAPMAVSLARTEVRQLPGTFGDPFRALEILPGVTPLISGLPFFYVRGAPPGNVGYYLDGIRVPYLYHVAIGPSVVQPAMVDRVDLYPGGYPARYGRYAGGIAVAETTPPEVTAHGEGNLRLIDAGAMVEGGFAGGRGTVLLGGRYSYTAAIISLLAKGVQLDYRDYQARVTYDVGAKDRLSLMAFGAYDLIAQETNGISTIGFGSEFYRGDLRWDHTLGPGSRVRTAVTLGFDQTAIGGERNAQDRLVGARTELDQLLAPTVHLHAGIDSVLDSYRVTTPLYADPDDPNLRRFSDQFPSRKDLALGVHGELALEVAPGFVVTPGMRADYFLSGAATAVGLDPRLSARIRVVPGLHMVHAFGIAHQPPSFILPIPGLALGSLANGLQTAYQASSGIEWGLVPSTLLTANAFNNVFTDITDTLSLPEDRGEDFSQRTHGRAYGLEVFLHRKLTQRIGGFLSYTLSRSTRRLGNDVFPSAFDRTHVCNGAVAYDLGRRWRAGTRLVLYSGAPKRVSTAATTNPQAPIGATTTAVSMAADPPRDPFFYRIDLRAEKVLYAEESVHLSFVAEWLNVTMHREVYNGTAIGPVTVPSLGLEGGF
ncbi:MAG: TonB family protein [Polyangiaceae bacterium]|nr:TonB family protein [Polyangiaceae bacterium]